jgi:hypothetical protein
MLRCSRLSVAACFTLATLGVLDCSADNHHAGSAGSHASQTTAGHGGASGSAAQGSSGRASGGAGNAGSGASGRSGPALTPGDPGAHDVLFEIDSSKSVHPISPYVYGTNQGDFKTEAKGLTLARVGGNRLTAYNWETNASNAGSDYMYENDSYISSSKVAGEPMRQAVKAASDAGASIIMTVPIAGWVSADESGPCDAHPASDAVIAQHFVPIVPKKGAAFAYPPDSADGKVYADEFVAWLEQQFPGAQTDATRRIFYMLDNEPDLWSSTHSEIFPKPLTYAALVQKSSDFAQAIKAAAPDALVFGPASYGWQGYVNLQGAPDANQRDFLEFYLDAMKSAEQAGGKRLLDVLDVHWYPEAQGDGKRITDDGTSAGEVEARLQAPRSLWDDTYTEMSWITQSSTHAPIALIPRLQKKIADHYPGTKLSISEYFYGAGGDISGGLAEVDALGIFGREQLFAATTWFLGKNNGFVFGAFALYRNYDGQGATFLDTSIAATTSATDKSSVYASVASGDDGKLVVIALNKTNGALKAAITISHGKKLAAADVYTLTSASPSPVKGTQLAQAATNAFNYTMPPRSATTLVFHP